LLLMGVIFGSRATERSLGPVLLLHVESLGYTSALLVGVLFAAVDRGALGHQIASALACATARRVIATAIVVAAAGLAVHPMTNAAWALMAGILAVGVGVGWR
jgi:hypothetical protein